MKKAHQRVADKGEEGTAKSLMSLNIEEVTEYCNSHKCEVPFLLSLLRSGRVSKMYLAATRDDETVIGDRLAQDPGTR